VPCETSEAEQAIGALSQAEPNRHHHLDAMMVCGSAEAPTGDAVRSRRDRRGAGEPAQRLPRAGSGVASGRIGLKNTGLRQSSSFARFSAPRRMAEQALLAAIRAVFIQGAPTRSVDNAFESLYSRTSPRAGMHARAL